MIRTDLNISHLYRNTEEILKVTHFFTPVNNKEHNTKKTQHNKNVQLKSTGADSWGKFLKDKKRMASVGFSIVTSCKTGMTSVLNILY